MDDNTKEEFEEIKQIASTSLNTPIEKKLLPTIITILIILGIFLIILAFNLDSSNFFSKLASNFGTEIIGSVIVFISIGIAMGTIKPRNGLLLKPKDLTILLTLFSFIFLLYSYSSFGAKTSVENFLGEIALNLFSTLTGSLIIYLLLESILASLKEREETIRDLLHRIDAITKKIQ